MQVYILKESNSDSRVAASPDTVKKMKDWGLNVVIQDNAGLKSNFSNEELAKINIEKSLKIGDEISGHFVYGHVDCTTNITNIKKLNNSWEFFFQNFKNKDKNFIVEKGSIAINGISLTIAKQDNNNFSISVIPHTFDNTNLKYLKVQDLVNIEFDYLARFSMKDKL